MEKPRMGQVVTETALPMLLRYSEGSGEESSGHSGQHSLVLVSRKEDVWSLSRSGSLEMPIVSTPH